MEKKIPEKVVNFKFHILFAITFCLIISSIIYISPTFLDILAYFWPLFLSTALFLVAVVVFGRTSPPPTEACAEKAGEGILDFVAGRPDEAAPPPEEEEEGTSYEFEPTM